jgi:integrase
MTALEWSDVDLHKRQLTVQRSEWKGHITATKGGRLRHVPMTERLTSALKAGGECWFNRMASRSR